MVSVIRTSRCVLLRTNVSSDISTPPKSLPKQHLIERLRRSSRTESRRRDQLTPLVVAVPASARTGKGRERCSWLREDRSADDGCSLSKPSLKSLAYHPMGAYDLSGTRSRCLTVI